MKKGIYSIPLLFSLFIFMNWCDKNDKLPPIETHEMWDCHTERERDKSEIYNFLVGEWEWEYVNYGWYPDGDYTENEGMVVNFNADGTAVVQEDGKITANLTWELTDGFEANLYDIDTEPFFRPLTGIVLTCGNRFIFYNSFVDGNDHYFTRVK